MGWGGMGRTHDRIREVCSGQSLARLPHTVFLMDIGSVSFLQHPWFRDPAQPLPRWAHWTMPEKVLMGIRRGLGLAWVVSISFCPREVSHDALDFRAPELGSGQGVTSNLTTSLNVRRLSLSRERVSGLWSWLWIRMLAVRKVLVTVENDLPARLEDLTTSVTLTFRHVWSATGVAVGGQRAVPETSVSLAGMAFRTSPVARRETVMFWGLWLSRAFW